MKKMLFIVADTNDADYVTGEYDITNNKELEELVRRVIPVIKKVERHNWTSHEYIDQTPKDLYEGKLSDEDIDWFDEIVPRNEIGLHTIISIKIRIITEEEDLL